MAENVEFHIPAIPYGNRNLTVKNFQEHSSSNSVQPPLPTLDLPDSENLSENREEKSQLAGPFCTNVTTLESAPDGNYKLYHSKRKLVNCFNEMGLDRVKKELCMVKVSDFYSSHDPTHPPSFVTKFPMVCVI